MHHGGLEMFIHMEYSRADASHRAASFVVLSCAMVACTQYAIVQSNGHVKSVSVV